MTEFHDKFGVFTDDGGNQLSFIGSYNESEQGTRNYESIKVFYSWNEPFAPLVRDDAQRFERLWNNFDPNVQVFNLPDAARAQILKLRNHERPYPAPNWDLLQARAADKLTSIQSTAWHVPPEVQLRDYQVEAIEAWITHDNCGLFEMATGTGKTITSLAATVRAYEQNRRLAVIIAVPYQHLVDQWQRDAASFGLLPILAYQSKSSWLNTLNQQINEYNHGDREELAVITTHTTFIDTDFQEAVGRLEDPCLLIADEVHHLGAERSQTKLPQNIRWRLALSATPDRWFDNVGTAVLRGYFGETVFKFTLDDAIRRDILTPYNYYPQLVELTPLEMQDYQALSAQIARLANTDNSEIQEAMEMLLMRRARLLNNAEQKLPVLKALLKQLKSVDHALFYCSPEQIDAVSTLVGWDLGYIIGRFTAEEPNAIRQQILADFDAEVLQALVAMKCLDEGVDVPSTRIAFILASSSNPREFVQRRGRILRRAPGKNEAIIYDFVTLPPSDANYSFASSAERSIIEHEIHRFVEFSNGAQNKHQALDVIWNIAKRYGVQI